MYTIHIRAEIIGKCALLLSWLVTSYSIKPYLHKSIENTCICYLPQRSFGQSWPDYTETRRWSAQLMNGFQLLLCLDRDVWTEGTGFVMSEDSLKWCVQCLPSHYVTKLPIIGTNQRHNWVPIVTISALIYAPIHMYRYMCQNKNILLKKNSAKFKWT